MLSLFRRQRHLSQRVLNEYLDNLLPDSARRRADREMAACAACRQELAGLTATVTALKQLPELPVRRNFTLAAPPGVAVVQAPVVLRLPNWTYAGAASLAGLVLAVLVSADAAGIPGTVWRDTGSETSLFAPAPLGMTAEGTPSPGGDQARTMKSAELVSATPVAGQTSLPPAAAPSAPGATLEPSPAVAAAPPAGPAGDTGPAGPGTDLPLAAETTVGNDAEIQELQESFGHPPPGPTPWFWRALEGVAAVAALLLLLALVLRRRMARR